MRYFDTSVVFSLYVNEARSPRVDAELRRDPADVTISHWVDIELKSALSLGVRSGRLSPEDGEAALSAVLECRLSEKRAFYRSAR